MSEKTCYACQQSGCVFIGTSGNRAGTAWMCKDYIAPAEKVSDIDRILAALARIEALLEPHCPHQKLRVMHRNGQEVFICRICGQDVNADSWESFHKQPFQDDVKARTP